MDPGTPLWALIIQAAGSIATVVTLIFLFVQIRLTRGQLATTDRNVESQRQQMERQTTAAVWSSQGANVFQLLAYLEEPRHLRARAVARELAGKPLDEWTADERAAADLVARIWTHAAIIQKLDILPHMFLQYYYGAAVSRSWHAVRPLVEEIRSNSDASQRQEFEALATEVDELGWFVGGDHRPADRYGLLSAFSTPTPATGPAAPAPSATGSPSRSGSG